MSVSKTALAAVTNPTFLGSTITVNFTDVQTAFGFSGFFNLGSAVATQRNWYDERSTWTGYMKGTQCRMFCTAGATQPYWISVDGSAEVAPIIATGAITLFTGLTDTWHFVTMRGDNGYSGTNNRTAYTGPLFELIGLSPAISKQSDLGVIDIFNDPASKVKHSFYNGVVINAQASPTGVLTNRNITNDYNGGCVMFRAKCESIWMMGVDTDYWLSIDGALPVRYSNPDSTNFIKLNKVTKGLDINNFHTYLLIPNGNSTGNLTAKSPVGIMIGGSGAAFTTLPATVKRIIQFGDSITCSSNGPGVYSGCTDLYKYAALLGYVGHAAGIAGRTTPGLTTAIPSIVAAQCSTIDVAVLAIGYNDPVDANFGPNYLACINAVLNAGITRIICRQIIPLTAGGGSVTNNNVMKQVIITLNNPNVTFMGSDSWATGIVTIDGTHPTVAGYITLASYETPYLLANLPH